MPDEFINPEEIKNSDLPLIVYSDFSSGIIQAIVKIRTKGFYNHVMWMHKENYFASQGNIYSEIKIKRYMKNGNRLKFVKILNLTCIQRKMIVSSINRKLKRPWWQNIYDWFGIFGQAIGLKQISTPGLDYCSEDVPRHLRSILPYISDKDIENFINYIPKHGSPEDLNEYMKKNKKFSEIFGRWDSDNENIKG